MTDSVDGATVFKVAILLGLGTLAMRIGGAELRHRMALPPTLRDALEWIPVAAIAAMISPTIVSPDLELSDLASWDLPRLLAATVSACIGYRSRNMLWGVGGGLAVYWLMGWIM